MQNAPTISVKLLMMLAGHFGQSARAEWAARYTFLGIRARLAVWRGMPILPKAKEIAEITRQNLTVVKRNLAQLRALGFLEPGVVDDPVEARPDPPEKFYTTFDLQLLNRIRKETDSYQTALALVHLKTFIRPGISEISVSPGFRSAIANQMGISWKKIRVLLTRLREMQILEEKGRRGRSSVIVLAGERREAAEEIRSEVPSTQPISNSQDKEEIESESTQKDTTSEILSDQPSSDPLTFDNMPLFEVHNRLVEMQRTVLKSPSPDLIKTANVLIKRYNERIRQLSTVIDALKNVTEEKGRELRARFKDYSDSQLRSLDRFQNSEELEKRLQRPATDNEKRFYEIRECSLRMIKPQQLGIIPLLEPGPGPLKWPESEEKVGLTVQQERKWNGIIREIWETVYNQTFHSPPRYIHKKMHNPIIAIRDLLFNELNFPLHRPDKETEVRARLAELTWEAAIDAKENPRGKNIGFTPGWMLTYLRVRMREEGGEGDGRGVSSRVQSGDGRD